MALVEGRRKVAKVDKVLVRRLVGERPQAEMQVEALHLLVGVKLCGVVCGVGQVQAGEVLAQGGRGLRDGGVRRGAAGGGHQLRRGAVGVGRAVGEEAQREGRGGGRGRGRFSIGRCWLRPVPRVLPACA